MTYTEQYAALLTYLRTKVELCDWHAVRDAAVDLEIFEAKCEVEGIVFRAADSRARREIRAGAGG